VLLSYLIIAADGIQERWPVALAIPLGVGLIRWRRSIGRALGGFYGVDYPPRRDPEPARATRESAQMLWSAGMLVLGTFLILVPAVILAGV
jgi:hypothetical protein